MTNVRETPDGEVLRMHSNGGHLDTSTRADFGAIEVWFNKNSLANILSLAVITDKYRMTMDSWTVNALIVHILEGHELRFSRVSERLYALDASNINISKLNSAFSFLLSTVEDNKSLYRARDIRIGSVISCMLKISGHNLGKHLFCVRISKSSCLEIDTSHMLRCQLEHNVDTSSMKRIFQAHIFSTDLQIP